MSRLRPRQALKAYLVLAVVVVFLLTMLALLLREARAEPSVREAGDEVLVRVHCIHQGAALQLLHTRPEQFQGVIVRLVGMGICAVWPGPMPVTLTQPHGDRFDHGTNVGSVWLATTPWGHPVWVMVGEPREL